MRRRAVSASLSLGIAVLALLLGAGAFMVSARAQTIPIYFPAIANTWTALQTFNNGMSVTNGISLVSGSLLLGSDQCCNIASATNRIQFLYYGNQIQGIGLLTDTNPQIILGAISTTGLQFGSGTSALDYALARLSTFAGSIPVIQTLSANTASSFAIAPTGTAITSNLFMFGTSDMQTNYQAMRQGFSFAITNSYSFQLSNGGTGTAPTGFTWLSGGTVLFGLTTTGIRNTQGYQSLIAVTLNAGTSTTVTLPIAEPDTTYGVVCTLQNATPLALSISGQTTTQFVINYPNIVGAQAAHCIIWHQ